MLTLLLPAADRDLIPGESAVRLAKLKSLSTGDAFDLGAGRLWPVQGADIYSLKDDNFGEDLAIAHLDFVPTPREEWCAVKLCANRTAYLSVYIDYTGNSIHWQMWFAPIAIGHGSRPHQWDYDRRCMAAMPWTVEHVDSFEPRYDLRLPVFNTVYIAHCVSAPVTALPGTEVG